MGTISKTGGNLLSRRQMALGVCAASVLMVSAGCAVKSSEGGVSRSDADLSVNSIEQLRSVRGSQGLRVYVAGFATPADGGDGVFAFVANSRLSTVADDVGFLVKSADGSGYWQREMSSNDVSVKWFGAVGDGARSDVAAVSTAAEVASRLGARVFVPAGTYQVDGIGTRVSLANLSLVTDSDSATRLSELVPATGRTINYYPASVN